ncbi:MAG: hypothetical protein QM775_12795 [Pirellulales bacterium]
MDDEEVPGETMGSNPSPTIISAKDLIAQSKAAAAEPAQPAVDPRKAADEALRNLLRRG